MGTPSLPEATGYLPNVPVTAIRMFNYDGTKKLRVSTYGRGIWEYALAIAPDYTNVISDTPQTVSAAQNATFSGTLTAVAGYASPVNLSCTGAKPTTCLLSTPQNPTPQATAQQSQRHQARLTQLPREVWSVTIASMLTRSGPIRRPLNTTRR